MDENKIVPENVLKNKKKQKSCKAKKGEFSCTIFTPPWCHECALWK